VSRSLSAKASSLTIDSAALLHKACQAGQQGSVLLVKHPLLPWPQVSCIERNQRSFGLAVHLDKGKSAERQSGLLSRSDELPFVEASFKQVALWHVIATGKEAELEEACRVLAPGGELLILGLNSKGFRARRDKEARDLPRLHWRALDRILAELGMEITGVLGAGIVGISSKAFQQNGLGALILPVADLLVIRARAVNPANASPVRLEQFRAGVAPSS
jgi:SAM-dependent methyltransferase